LYGLLKFRSISFWYGTIFVCYWTNKRDWTVMDYILRKPSLKYIMNQMDFN